MNFQHILDFKVQKIHSSGLFQLKFDFLVLKKKAYWNKLEI